jgi:hypothetical protein
MWGTRLERNAQAAKDAVDNRFGVYLVVYVSAGEPE